MKAKTIAVLLTLTFISILAIGVITQVHAQELTWKAPPYTEGPVSGTAKAEIGTGVLRSYSSGSCTTPPGNSTDFHNVTMTVGNSTVTVFDNRTMVINNCTIPIDNSTFSIVDDEDYAELIWRVNLPPGSVDVGVTYSGKAHFYSYLYGTAEAELSVDGPVSTKLWSYKLSEFLSDKAVGIDKTTWSSTFTSTGRTYEFKIKLKTRTSLVHVFCAGIGDAWADLYYYWPWPTPGDCGITAEITLKMRGTADLRVEVKDSEKTAPISGASVHIWPTVKPDETTDSEGRAWFRGLDITVYRTYWAFASHKYYIEGGDSKTLDPGVENPLPISLMRKKVTITIKIEDAGTGAAISGASVSLSGPTDGVGGWGAASYSGTTGDDGKVAFTDKPAGVWDASASAAHYFSGSSTGNDVTSDTTITIKLTPSQYLVTVTTSGLPSPYSTPLYVDGGHVGNINDATSWSGWFDSGSTHTFSVNEHVDNGTGARYHCPSYSQTITVTSAQTSTFQYHTEYYLTVDVYPAGLPKPSGEGWYDSGARASLNAGPVDGYAFYYWDVDGVSQGIGVNPITVTMDAPHTATAHYRTESTLTVICVPPQIFKGQTTIIKGRLKDSLTGEGLAGRTIHLYCEEAWIADVATDEVGFYSYGPWGSHLDNGTYLIRAVFDGDEYYVGSADTATLNVFAKEKVIRDVLQELYTLRSSVQTWGSHEGIKNSLLAKIDNSIMKCDQALGYIAQGDVQSANEVLTAAKNMLHAFTNECKAQSGKKIPTETATNWITQANAIISHIETAIITPI